MPTVARWLRPILVVAALAAAPPAHGYEFWVRARAMGEAYELRGFRVVGGELAIGRRRYTQVLTLVLRDLGDLERARRRAGRWRTGPVVSWRAGLRFDQDFGTFLTGRLAAGPTTRQDALDLIPELSPSAFALALLYGELRVEGLWRGKLELAAGRLVDHGGDGAPAVDGVGARLMLTPWLELGVSGGLAVRESSPLAAGSHELDGAAGSFCHEYVEAAAGQVGRWRLIERSQPVKDGRYTSDYELCPQREVRMPTASLTLATRELYGVVAELGYRIALSPTVGRIGAIDRLREPDLGLYPNERGQAPAWGTNTEQLRALVSGRWRVGALELSPQALVRASLAHGVVDRAELGGELRYGAHSLTPSVARLVPTFDTDSIWNAFAAEPSTELDLAYRVAARAALELEARLWARRFDGGDADGAAWAWGARAELVRPAGRLWRWPLRWSMRALADTGYGGDRLAGDAELGWGSRQQRVVARGALVWARGDRLASEVAPGGSLELALATVAATASARLSYALSTGVRAHTAIELWRAGDGETALRALAVLELELEPNR